MKSKPVLLPSSRRRGAASRLGRALAPLATAALASLLLTSSVGLAQSALPASRAPNLPTLGDTEREDLSPAMERKLGEDIMHDIRRDRDYLDDAPLLEYLNQIGSHLVAARPDARGETSFDYFFFAVRDTQLNAFALPGGFIAVHSALLLAAQSEAELASVLSHEIGHVAQRHIARSMGQQRQDALIPLAAMLLAALASRAGAGGDAAIGVFMGGQGLAVQRQLNFSRDAEREADRIGFQIMGEAGFDASGMVAFFGRLQAASRSYSDLAPAWLLTHPLTTERIADIQGRIREMPYKQRADSLDFYLARARARVLQDDSTQGLADANAFFEAQRQQLGGFSAAAAQYGLAFCALKRGELDKAQSGLDAARATLYKPAPAAPGAFGMAFKPPPPNPMLASMGLEIKLAPGQPKAVTLAAVAEAAAAHLQFPLSRGIARQYAEAMIAADRVAEAITFLREQARLYREEPQLYDLLAKAYAAQGQRARQHMALTEAYALRGSVLAALDQLTIARKASDASFYDMAEIDARERDLQARHRQDKESKK